MELEKFSISAFLFQMDWKVLIESAGMDPTYEVENFVDVVEIMTVVSMQPASLIITAIYSKDDLLLLANVVKKIKETRREKVTKFVVVNFSKNKEFEKTFVKLGIQDSIDPTINQKAFRYKIDFWMKSLNAAAKKSDPKGQQQGAEAKSRTQTQSTQEGGAKVDWIPALTLEDDIWIVKKKTEVKGILGRFVIKLMGPGPFVGAWTQLKANLWRFDINEEERTNYLQGEDTWYFKGEERPDFVWSENLWMFTGGQSELYYTQGMKTFYRFFIKEKVLSIAENSVMAQMKELIIVDSFDKELKIKKEQEESAQKKIEDDTKFRNLDGKSSTEKIDQGPLKGVLKKMDEVFGDEDEIADAEPATREKEGPLSHDSGEKQVGGKYKWKTEGEVARDDDPWGVAPEKHRDRALLDTESNNRHEKFMRKHNEADEASEGSLPPHEFKSEKASEAPLLDTDADGKHEKFYKNHNEAREFEKKDRPRKEKARGLIDDSYEENNETSADNKFEKFWGSKKRDSEAEEDGEDQDAVDRGRKEKKKRDTSGLSDWEREMLSEDESNETDSSDEQHENSEQTPDELKRREREERQQREAKIRDEIDGLIRPTEERESAERERSRAREKERKPRERGEITEQEFGDFSGPASENPRAGEQLGMEANGKHEKFYRNRQGDRDELEKNDSSERVGRSHIDKRPGRDDSEEEGASDSEEDLEESTAFELPGKSCPDREGDADVKDYESIQDDRAEANEFTSAEIAQNPDLRINTEDPGTDDLRRICESARLTLNVAGKFTDLFDRTLVLESEDPVFSKAGASVSVKITLEYLRQDIPLSIDGEVTELEGPYVTIAIRQMNNSEYRSFMKWINFRQRNINSFLRISRGL